MMPPLSCSCGLPIHQSTVAVVHWRAGHALAFILQPALQATKDELRSMLIDALLPMVRPQYLPPGTCPPKRTVGMDPGVSRAEQDSVDTIEQIKRAYARDRIRFTPWD